MAGVSAFGIAGTNAHVVLESAAGRRAPRLRRVTEGPFLLPLSARSPEALRALAAAVADLLAAPGAARGTRRLRHRCAASRGARLSRRVCGSDRAGSRRSPAPFCWRRGRGGAQSYSESVDERHAPDRLRVPGQGAQWAGMVRELIAHEPAFRAALERADAALRPCVPWSLIAQLGADEGDENFLLDRISVIQPVLLAVEMRACCFVATRGVEPAAVVGHSMGELGAACLTVRSASMRRRPSSRDAAH